MRCLITGADGRLGRALTRAMTGRPDLTVWSLPKDRLDVAIRILPGMRSPTVLPLAQEGWCSIHAVISQDQLWERIERLKEIGAEGILILALENMIR